MKYLFSLLLMLAFNAGAQVPRPSAFPGVNGNHEAAPRFVQNAKGTFIYWFPIVKGQVEIAGLMCRPADCKYAVFHQVHMSILKATAKVRTAGEAWDQHVNFKCDREFAKVDTSNGRLCAEWFAIFDANKAAWLPGVK